MINWLPHIFENKSWIPWSVFAIALGGSGCYLLEDLTSDIHMMGQEVAEMNNSMTLIQKDIHSMTDDVGRIADFTKVMAESVDKMSSDFRTINHTVYRIGADTHHMARSASQVNQNVDSVMGPFRQMRSFMPF